MNQPAYPEYEELRAEAEATRPRFVDPAVVRQQKDMRTRRGADWCTAVLGREDGTLTCLDAHMLMLADQRDLNPPLPAPIIAARQERRAQEEETARRREAARDRDRAKYDAALEACDVPVTVRPNVNGRHLSGGFDDGPLRHVTPDVDAVSGRTRTHPAHRPLCERPDRAKPRVLGEPAKEHGTCGTCLAYMPKIRVKTTVGQTTRPPKEIDQRGRRRP